LVLFYAAQVNIPAKCLVRRRQVGWLRFAFSRGRSTGNQAGRGMEIMTFDDFIAARGWPVPQMRAAGVVFFSRDQAVTDLAIRRMRNWFRRAWLVQELPAGWEVLTATVDFSKKRKPSLRGIDLGGAA
jgi:hypothetical protein